MTVTATSTQTVEAGGSPAVSAETALLVSVATLVVGVLVGTLAISRRLTGTKE